jgi:DNA-binding LacI/PurR family transcriptional regulator
VERDPVAPLPTLADVVRASGYSKATVSRALSGSPQVSPATRTAIRAVADRLGWEPKPEFAALTQRRWANVRPRGSGVIGFWSTAGSELLNERFRTACVARGYRADILAPSTLAGGHLNEYLELHGICGLVISSIVDGSMPDLDLSRLSAVVVGDDLPELRVDRVCHDWQDAAERCVDAVLAAGRKRIGFTCLPYGGIGTRLAIERARACAQARLQAAGAYLAPGLITGGENVSVLTDWIRDHQLNGVITDTEAIAWCLHDHCPDIETLLLRATSRRRWTGMAIRGQRIMDRAIALVHEALALRHRGTTTHPERLMVPGEWVIKST